VAGTDSVSEYFTNVEEQAFKLMRQRHDSQPCLSVQYICYKPHNVKNEIKWCVCTKKKTMHWSLTTSHNDVTMYGFYNYFKFSEI